MARARDPNRDKAFELYKQHEGKIPLKDIAAELGKGEGTVRGWKNKDDWDGQLNGTLQSDKRNAPNGNAERSKVKKTVKSVSPEIQRVVQAHEEITEENIDLTDSQRFFCLYYVKYMNATKAYQKAYETNYESAHSNAHRLMAKEGIRNEILRLKRERAAGILLDGNDVLQKYMDIAFSDIGDYLEYGTEEVELMDDEGLPLVDQNGDIRTYARSYVRFKNGTTLDNTVISEVKQGKDGVSIKLYDKMKALEFLAKYTDLLDDLTKTQLQNEKTKVDAVNAALKQQQDSELHKLKLEQMQLNIDKTEAELDKINDPDADKDITINFVRKGDAL